MPSSVYEERAERTRWFMRDRFGMFIHWGLYAIPGRGEWVRNRENIPDAAYAPYFDEFNPIDYDPKTWARAAREAGVRYAILTAKHHEGFCLFDSRYTDYKATNTLAQRDLVKEFVEAFRAEDLKVGLYYSLIDWHHPDYPHYGDPTHPTREMAEYKDSKHDFPKYVEYLHNQVRELLTNYGKIDIMWFDFSYKGMTGDTWEAAKLVDMVRGLQPHIVIDNRLIYDRLGGGVFAEEPISYAGDFASPEQIIPTNGLLDEAGRPVPWESCVTLNNHWGYGSKDKDYATPRDVIHMLVNTTSKNGNLLINVGPNARGQFPKEFSSLLSEVGQWMAANGESIYGCGASDLPKPEWGRYTQKGSRLFAHIYERGPAQFRLDSLKGRVKKARLLADGSELDLITWREDYPNDAFIELGAMGLPDETDTVVELEV